MSKKFNEEFGGNSNAKYSQKSSTTTNSPSSAAHLGSDTTMPPQTDGALSECIVAKAVADIKAAYKAPANETYIVFGASFLRPPASVTDGRKLSSPLMTPEMLFKLLGHWDRCEVALMRLHKGFSERPPKNKADMKKRFAPLGTAMKRLMHVAALCCHEIDANKAEYEAKGAPTEQELMDAFERWQFQQRKDLGEPVILRNNRLCFEKYIFEAGYRPGPFPGLDLYTLDGKPVDPKTFKRFLESTKAQRKARMDDAVGFFGCPACDKVRAADMVWLYGQRYGVHGPESYHELIKSADGTLPPLPTLNSSLIQGALLMDNPLPCMAQD